MFVANVAKATGNHNWFMIASHFTCRFLFIGSKIPKHIWSAKFVAKTRTAKRRINHNVECRLNAVWLAIWLFPGLFATRDIEIRYTIASKPNLWLSAAPSSAFIANFTTAASCRTWEGRNGRWVIMGFYLNDRMDWLLNSLIFAGFGICKKSAATRTAQHRCIVGIGR